MFANGFTAELLLKLVRVGLAYAHAERMVGDGKMTEVARVKISEAGWQALAGDATNGRARSGMKRREFVTFAPPSLLARADAPIE